MTYAERLTLWRQRDESKPIIHYLCEHRRIEAMSLSYGYCMECDEQIGLHEYGGSGFVHSQENVDKLVGPDPFEEWWHTYDNEFLGPSKSLVKKGWNAGVEWQEGQSEVLLDKWDKLFHKLFDKYIQLLEDK